MSKDKEFEIQMQFLDEASDYIDVLDQALLTLTQRGIETEKINAALRSAHSIKGGAGMMGFEVLSNLAHCLEDSLKVLKVDRSVPITPELEQLLLTGVDCLRSVIHLQRHHQPIDPVWLETQVYPIFTQLHQHLGDPIEEDAQSILSPEEGQDIIRLLFQTEVEGCLERLETVIAHRDPRLAEELEILTQELGGLGEMLQIPAFSSLCQSIATQLRQTPQQATSIAQLALQAWRQSQRLILANQWADLPTALPVAISQEGDLTASDLAVGDGLPAEPVPGFGAESTPDMIQPLSDLIAEEEIALQPAVEPAADWEADPIAANLITPLIESDLIEPNPIAPNPITPNLVNPDSPQTAANSSETSLESDITLTIEADLIDRVADQTNASLDDLENVGSVGDVDININGNIESNLEGSDRSAAHPSSYPAIDTTNRSTQSSSNHTPHTPHRVTHFVVDTGSSDGQIPESQPIGSPEASENTVRVPLKQLEQLNDLFSELIIERNGLDLHLKRLRNLVQTLSRRIKVLEETNTQIRDAYDKVEPHGNFANPPESAASSQIIKWQPSGSGSRFSPEFDALEMDRYNPLHLISQEMMETIVQVQEVTSDIELGLEDTEQTTRELNKTSRQLQTRLTQVRMRPLSDITNRFPRALRELSLQHQKPVQFKIQGEHLLIDRNILEALNEPLMHLLRNAFDHGIESPEVRQQQGKPAQGLIQIQAVQQQNRTVITLSDDGGGIPIDKIRARARQMGLDEMLLAAASDDELLSLIFEPGFSTSDRVTALSGRGVGMDVVRERLKQIQGEISISTTAGRGTTFTLSVPFTLSVARVLLAESHGLLLGFPTDLIEEISVVQPEQIFSTAGNLAFEWKNSMVQLIALSQWLNFYRPIQPEGLETPASITVPTVLLVKHNSQWLGLQVDRCWGEQEVAIRQVEGGLPLPTGFSSCAILGDGRVVPMINLSELLHWIASCERARDTESHWTQRLIGSVAEATASLLPSLPVAAEPQPTVLIVDDSVNVRRFLALTLEKAGYQVAQAKDGQDAIDKLAAGLTVQAVICDIEMPRVDGYEFLARVKSTPALQQIPIAMLTSRSGEKHRRLAMNLGATAYFSKPYNEQALLQTLERMLEATPVLLSDR